MSDSGELPTGWVEATIGDCGRWTGGGTPSKAEPRFWTDGTVPWVSPKDMKTQRLADAEDRITEEAIRASATSLIAPNSVLLVTRSGILSRTVPVAINSVSVTLNQDMKAVTPHLGIVPDLLANFIRGREIDILATCAKSGTTVASLEFERLKAFPMALPPTAEQRRIVARLDALQAHSRGAREALADVPALLDTFRRSVLAAAFRGDLTAEWRSKNPDVEPASVLVERIRAERKRAWELAHPKKPYLEPGPVDDSALPELPEGWCWAALQDVAEVQLGQRRAPEYVGLAEYPYIRAANITWRGLDLSDVQTMGFGPVDGLFLRPGDVLLNEASGSPTEVGKPALWSGEIAECCFQATVLRLRPRPDISSNWLYRFCFAEAILERYLGSTPGTGILHLSSTRMKRWPVPLAPKAEQTVIAKLLGAALANISTAENESQRFAKDLDTLDQSILARAFRGGLVPQDPNDEPAAVLLARIRGEPAPAKTRKRSTT